MDTKEYLQARKSPNWKFNMIVPAGSFRSIRKVHPIKQAEVKAIVDVAKTDPNVKRIIIFGSSTRYDCDLSSDLDICIDWNQSCYDEEGVLMPFTKNMRQCISKTTKGNADVINYGYFNEDIRKAVEEGVVVYEHDV